MISTSTLYRGRGCVGRSHGAEIESLDYLIYNDRWRMQTDSSRRAGKHRLSEERAGRTAYRVTNAEQQETSTNKIRIGLVIKKSQLFA